MLTALILTVALQSIDPVRCSPDGSCTMTVVHDRQAPTVLTSTVRCDGVEFLLRSSNDVNLPLGGSVLLTLVNNRPVDTSRMEELHRIAGARPSQAYFFACNRQGEAALGLVRYSNLNWDGIKTLEFTMTAAGVVTVEREYVTPLPR
jgi:hypothetical protein